MERKILTYEECKALSRDKNYKVPEQNALFLTKDGQKCFATIKLLPMGVDIEVYNEQHEEIGYLRGYDHPNKTIFLDVIYVYDGHRGQGIAPKMNELFEEYLAPDTIIRGVFNPGQLSTDRDTFRPYYELAKRATAFYEHNGYHIISYMDFLDHPFGKYPRYVTENTFDMGEGNPDTIVVKKIKQKEKPVFQEVDGVLMHVDMLASTQPDRGER